MNQPELFKRAQRRMKQPRKDLLREQLAALPGLVDQLNRLMAQAVQP